MKFTTLIVVMLLNAFTGLSAQVTGLWTVKKVTVGEEHMTPVAKWFRLEANGALTGGNGGLRNLTGAWRLKEPASELLMLDESGQTDPYGPFKLTMDAADRMQWQRREEGQAVTVSLVRVTEIPAAPWDRIVGNWTLAASDDQKEDSFFFRWDRRYIRRDEAGEVTDWGVWHIHAHRPELRLLSDQGDERDETWTISFPGTTELSLSDAQQPARLYKKRAH